MTTRGTPPLVVAGAGVAIVAVLVLLAVGVGTVWISPLETLRVLADHVLPFDIETSDIADPIIWNIRLPRILAAAGSGAALGLAGAVLSGTYRNPYADPHLMGMSAFGAIGVLLGGWLAWSAWGPIGGVAGGAIAGAAGAFAILYLGDRLRGDPTHFIVVGIGVGLAVSAVVAAAAIAIHDPRVPDLPFWFVGGLAASTWGTALWVSVLATVALVAVGSLSERLDVMSLGWASAAHVGVDVRRVVVVGLVAIGMGTGAAVGAAGVVAFVGLMATHIARRMVGDHHAQKLVASFFAGAAILILADALGRLIGGRFEVPVGLITAAVGGPFLVVLVARRGMAR